MGFLGFLTLRLLLDADSASLGVGSGNFVALQAATRKLCVILGTGEDDG